MTNYKNAYRISGIVTLIIAMIVYFMTVQRTGSLWDVGEFILGSYKLEVVHPPGAPLFLIVGRIFAWIGDLFSSDPATIGFMVNLLSGICTAFAAMFSAWVTFLLGKLALVGRENTTTASQNVALIIAGIAAGLAGAFSISVWFSAVEGEVYAMSLFFTMMTLWAMVVWYAKPHGKQYDRWILLALYSAGLSTGVHLLSLLTLPAIALLYYFKRYEKINAKGLLASLAIGGGIIIFVQKIVIVGAPTLWYWMDKFMVNSFGLPPNSGAVPTVLILAALAFLGLRYAHKKKSHLIQMAVLAAILITTGFSTIGVVVIRANANTPVNMNAPTDPSRLLPYINREQYGDRPLLYGPSFDAQAVDMTTTPRYGYDGKKYSIVDYKIKQEFRSSDKMLFPRMGHNDPNRKALYQQEWMGRNGSPTFGENLSFFIRYQLNWMYWRYFMQNFVGRQNADQGYTQANVADGNWYSGIKFIDEMRLYYMGEEPDVRSEASSRNAYFFLPLIFGIIGMIFQFKRRQRDFFTLLLLFFITGIALIIYANSPPHEPRERDYVFAGSFMTFGFFIGFAVLAIFEFLREKVKSLPSVGSAVIAGALVLTAPIIMGFQNYDDMGRQDLYASRDYAANFLNSVAENAILFTYGDNDTYPLWYAQEVEGIRTDVRVVNLSLISVDWYINLLRVKMNDSAPLKLTLSKEAIRGYKRNQIFLNPGTEEKRTINAEAGLKFINSPKAEISTATRQMNQYIVPANKFALTVDKQKAIASGWAETNDPSKIANELIINPGGSYMTKDELALMDIIVNNVHDRPIYYATTVQTDKLIGLQDFMKVEGLAMRVTPIKQASDRRYQIFGSGRIDSDLVLENITTKFKWGNFDQVEQFVDESFKPAIQSHRTVMLRTVNDFLDKGQSAKAAQVADVFFKAFPNMNFPLDYYTTDFIRAYIANGEMEKARKHMLQLRDNVVANARFFDSLQHNPDASKNLDKATFGLSFGQKKSLNDAALNNLLQLSNSLNDEALKQEIQNDVLPYLQRQQIQG